MNNEILCPSLTISKFVPTTIYLLGNALYRIPFMTYILFRYSLPNLSDAA